MFRSIEDGGDDNDDDRSVGRSVGSLLLSGKLKAANFTVRSDAIGGGGLTWHKFQIQLLR